MKREVMDLALSGKTGEPHFEEITTSVAQCKTKEDAAFIVRAVNSHEELLRSLKNVLAHSELLAGDIREQAVQAIAKAEGR